MTRALLLGCLALISVACSAATNDAPDEPPVVDTESDVVGGELGIVRDDADFFVVKNSDATWWIAKRCISSAEKKSVDFGAGAGPEVGAVGPGHIFRAYADLDGNGSQEKFVDDWAGGELPWIGLLSFAYHHIRAAEGSIAKQGVENGGNTKGVANRFCATDSSPPGFGASGATNGAGGPPKAKWVTPGQELEFTIATDLLAFGDKVMTVEWDYHFKPTKIEVETTVSPVASKGDWVKEPKFSAVVAKPNGSFAGFSEYQVFDSNGHLVPATDGNTLHTIGGNAQNKTWQFADPTRARARFAYAGGSCGPSSKCLKVEARSGDKGNWHSGTSSGNSGLDRWATDANAAGALGAFDSGCKVCGTGGANCRCDQCPAPTSCNACKLPLANDCRLPNGDMVPYSANLNNRTLYWACGGSLSGLRRWEAAGNNDYDGVNPGPGFYFHGWEGGSGPDDCENRALRFTGGSYSNFFVIDIVPETGPSTSPPSPPPNPAPDPGASCGQLASGSSLSRGQSLWSCDGRFQLSMQNDGNLVLYQSGKPLWASNTWKTDAQLALMAPEGNFMLKDSAFNTLWATNTWGHAGASAVVQNDGNLVVYENQTALWASNTGGH